MGVNLFDESETLCFWVLIKKHVFLYHYFQGQFKLFKEIPLNDTPLLMSWTGDYINLQFKDHIICLNIHTNQSPLQMLMKEYCHHEFHSMMHNHYLK